MSLEQAFKEINRSQQFWHSQQRVLVAVSGGVDSLVLLALLENLPMELRPFIGVAHVNHQLRAEATAEAAYLRAYCKKKELPYYEMLWEYNQEQGNLEGAGRDARYAFFAQVCQQENYECLITAHHGDDQAETLLMKLTSGSLLQNMTGIPAVSSRQGLLIYRPLLPFSKAELVDYAQRKAIVYFEDASNHSTDYFRNRIRQQIVPILKTENANFLKHIHNLVKQIGYANDIVAEKAQALRAEMVQEITNECWEIDLTKFAKLSTSHQVALLTSLWQLVLVEKGIHVNDSQLRETLSMFSSAKPQQEIHLEAGWRMVKRYQYGQLIKVKMTAESSDKTAINYLTANSSLFLTNQEWLGLEVEGQPLEIPKALSNWHRQELNFEGRARDLPLEVRRPQAGDRFCYNKEGQLKKIGRLLIDEKIPRELRQQTWLVSNRQKESLWIIPIRKSYLSIVKETDKIHYRLIYLKDK